MKTSIKIIGTFLLGMIWSDSAVVAETHLYTEENAANYLSELDKKAETLKAEILQSKTTITPSQEGTTYYISNNGNDANPGKAPKMAWATLQRVNSAGLKEGDVVFFERNGLWRGYLQAKRGVTYSAYGEGDKPKLYGSPENAADPKKWAETDTKNVYVYSGMLTNDVGTLVFDDGAQHAIKVIIRTEKDGATFNNTTGEPFKTYADLKHDLHFYHDYRNSGKVYLYSENENPGKRFHSIELNVKGNVVRIGGNNITVDNFCIKYGGSHGVGSGTTKNLTVSNCEFGWIGGSIQSEGIYGRNHATRFGNGAEIWGGCQNYRVENCYFYQIYDAGATQQFYSEGKTTHMDNVRYSHNLMEYCNYSVEYFLSGAKEGDGTMIDGFWIENNIMRFAGKGFCQQRPDKTEAAHIKSWNHENPAKNFHVRNNVFQDSYNMLLHISSAFPNNMPEMNGNVYIQKEDGLLGLFGQNAKPREPFNKEVTRLIEQKIGDTNAVILFTK